MHASDDMSLINVRLIVASFVFILQSARYWDEIR